MSARLSLAASILVVVACLLAIVSTYHRISQTWDEPNHIATGLEWLQEGSYMMWTENPPLARIALAMGPYLDGARLPAEGHAKEDIEATSGVAYFFGNTVLYGSGDYLRRLTLARVGNLPFFLLAAAVLWIGIGRHRPPAGFLAVAAFCTLPAVLGHSGLATTDIAFVAMFLLFVRQLVDWLQEATAVRAVSLGICLGLVVATKFTAIVFVPAAATALIAAWLWEVRQSGELSFKPCRLRAIHALLIAPAAAFLVIWGAYGFSIGSLSQLPAQLGDWAIYGSDAGGWRGELANALADRPLPAPEFLHGLLVLFAHNDGGHPAYALGKLSDSGFWYFYPLALWVKTPFPFMILAASGFAAAIRRGRATPWWVWGLFGAAALILLALTSSRVNIGLRHLLAVYALVALAAAAALASVLERIDARGYRLVGSFLLVLLAWQAGGAALARPGFLAYFNPIAGDDPGAYLVDSDLDWGQAVFELERFVSQHEVESLHIAYNGSAQLCAHDLPPLNGLEPDEPVRGWVAVSELFYRDVAGTYWAGPPCNWAAQYPVERPESGWFPWLRKHEPVAVLGRSIRIYYLE